MSLSDNSTIVCGQPWVWWRSEQNIAVVGW
jgi:hypothetical protein